MSITNVTISQHVRPSPKSDIIIVRKVITGGSGLLEEAIQGAKINYSVTLDKGHEVRALQKGEQVFVSGTNDAGDEFSLPVALTTETVHRPWKFAGSNNGSTG